jgi:hypothetical protein
MNSLKYRLLFLILLLGVSNSLVEVRTTKLHNSNVWDNRSGILVS